MRSSGSCEATTVPHCKPPSWFLSYVQPQLHTCAATSVALHVSDSRYTCRGRSPEKFMYPGGGLALHTPLKGTVAPVARRLPGVPRVKLPLKWCRATGGV